ncbi:MAG: helix-turn-helix domain-containing protein [Nanoarchaeota archaeon]
MENILEEIGLTQNETKVYLALNELGTSTISPIVEKAGISNSKIYIILGKLIKKGLVSHIVINRINNYKTSQPERILDFLKDKKKSIEVQEGKIKDILPKLLSEQNLGLKDREVEVFEGFNGLKSARERELNLLKKGDEMLVLGASKFSTSQYEYYWENYHKRRISKGINCKFLMYEETRENVGKKREKWRLTKVKYLKESVVNPIRIDIYLDYVDIAIDAVAPFVISIKSKEVNDSFKNYFKALWKIAKQ